MLYANKSVLDQIIIGEIQNQKLVKPLIEKLQNEILIRFLGSDVVFKLNFCAIPFTRDDAEKTGKKITQILV